MPGLIIVIVKKLHLTYQLTGEVYFGTGGVEVGIHSGRDYGHHAHTFTHIIGIRPQFQTTSTTAVNYNECIVVTGMLEPGTRQSTPLSSLLLFNQ